MSYKPITMMLKRCLVRSLLLRMESHIHVEQVSSVYNAIRCYVFALDGVFLSYRNKEKYRVWVANLSQEQLSRAKGYAAKLGKRRSCF